MCISHAGDDGRPERSELLAHVERVLVTREQIERRVGELAERIAADLDSRPLTLAAVMTGAMIFTADLIRHLPVMMKIHLVSMSSYPGESTVSQGVTLRSPLPESLAGQTVLIVDDILDSGRTLQVAVRKLKEAGAARVLTCVLVRKPESCRMPDGLSDVDYAGFDIPDEFVVGYGLDYGDYYRNLPEIAVLRQVRRQE